MERSNYQQRCLQWINHRLPVITFLKYLANSPTPKNLNYSWTLGAIAIVALTIQVITGIFLSMHYTPHVDHAFASIEHIMREVNYGWLLRYTHTVGASMFFAAVYIHMFRSIYYRSYKTPRELVWHTGLIIFVLMIATAFTGYVLPWGQMSYWGTVVITNIFSALPVVGERITTWIWGGFTVNNATLMRLFTLHYLIPFLLIAILGLHLITLHVHGSNNPQGIKLKKTEYLPFYPYHVIKDCLGIGVYLLIFAYFVFYQPTCLNHPDNYLAADPLVTPAHIVPEWYFAPFYAILRAIPSKSGGITAMLGSIFILFFLPWLDRAPADRGNRYRLFNYTFWLFTIVCLVLGYTGSKPIGSYYLWLTRIATVYYFSYFLLLLPLITKYEKPLSDLSKHAI